MRALHSTGAVRMGTEGHDHATGVSRSRRRGLIAGLGIGLCSGALAGFFGVGGGILIVPALVFLLRVDQRLAHGTSSAAILPMACMGVVGYAQGDSVDWVAAALLVAGAAGGAVLGVYVLQRLPLRVLRIAFALLLAATAIRMIMSTASADQEIAIDPLSALALVAIGLVAGVVAGLLGVGGGIVVVPALTMLMSTADALAKGTSLAMIVPTSIVATVRNIRAGNVDLVLAAAIGLSGMASSYLASRLSIATDPGVARVLFAALLLVVALVMVFTRERPARPSTPS